MSESPPQLVVEPLAEHATERAGILIKTILDEAGQEGGMYAIALAGGTTPHALYQHLSQTAVSGEIPWSGAQVFFGDERDVPHDNVESNYHMIQRTLLDHVPIQPDQVHPMPADAEDLDTAAAEYEQCIRESIPSGKDGVPRFDLILLGMGGDGHTASLFPCTPKALSERKKLVLAHFVPVLGRNRMTFTLPLINAARNVLMLVTGEDKAEAVAAMLSGDKQAKQKIPAAWVAPSDGRFLVVLDAAAGRKAGLPPGAGGVDKPAASPSGT